MYEIINIYKSKSENTNILFYYIEIDDIKKSLKETYKVMSDSSWIEKLSDETLKDSFRVRLEYTISELYDLFQEDTKLSRSTGEYLISVTSKKIIVNDLKYSDIPLGEAIGKRTIGNGGFDYYAENLLKNYIIFGEAKYRKDISAYTDALDQIVEFINKEKDIADYADIAHFVSENAKKNMKNNVKGYSAGFTFKGYADKLIDKISKSLDYAELLKYEELVLIGVKINYGK